MLLGYISAYGKTSTLQKKMIAEDRHQALRFIHNHYRDEITSEDVAQAIGGGYSRFRKIFQKHTGKSPYHYIQETRIKKSKFLIMNTTKPLKEIAYEVGFTNPDYLSTAFRPIAGFSPTNLRKNETM